MSESRQPEGGLPQVQREYAGSWVAFKGGKVVEARRSPYELVAALHERDIKDTNIVRIPSEDEPELVGLG
jgi:hypothetical protein